MNTQKKFLKVLSMLTIILLIATIFIPGNGNRNAVASIGILGILLLFLSTLLPKIYKLTLNLLKNQGKTSPWSSLKSSEPVSETEATNHDQATRAHREQRVQHENADGMCQYEHCE